MNAAKCPRCGSAITENLWERDEELANTMRLVDELTRYANSLENLLKTLPSNKEVDSAE